MQVREIMSTAPEIINPATPLRDVARLMRDRNIGAVPLGADDRLLGMLTDRDIVVRGLAEHDDCSTLTAQQVTTEALRYCFDDEEVDQVASNMSQQQLRRLPVVNRDKRLVGMVSLGDVAQNADPERSGEALRGISS